jgi:hypothetical protein
VPLDPQAAAASPQQATMAAATTRDLMAMFFRYAHEQYSRQHCQ